MIELKANSLVVSFPDVFGGADLTIDFQRTLRIPDDGQDYPLPPGLGKFPLRHVDDFARRVPGRWLRRGGVLLPMWQSEALWLNFHSTWIEDRQAAYPFAIKVATGRMSAITGKTWQPGLRDDPQDYLVVPTQPWLDGYCVEKGVIRQFVAMPLGQGYTVEEQLTGQAEFGGIQLEIFPMRREAFEKRFPKVPRLRRLRAQFLEDRMCCLSDAAVGLAPGGRMRQEIYADPFASRDWDTGQGSRCFIHLVNSAAWREITGQTPPSMPITAAQYTAAGFPWFEYYSDSKALAGAPTLSALKSVAEKTKENGKGVLPENESVETANVIKLRAGLSRDQVREAEVTE